MDRRDFLALGEGRHDAAALTKAVSPVAAGAQFVVTNPDAAGPDEEGIVPAAGAFAAMIETRTDFRGGMKAGLETILVLSGASSGGEVVSSPYRPNDVIGSVAESES